MGCYDTYGSEGIQLKAGECILKHHNIGDKVDLADGVYVAYEGLVVISSGKFVAELPPDAIFNKWGGMIAINLDNYHPFMQKSPE